MFVAITTSPTDRVAGHLWTQPPSTRSWPAGTGGSSPRDGDGSSASASLCLWPRAGDVRGVVAAPMQNLVAWPTETPDVKLRVRNDVLVTVLSRYRERVRSLEGQVAALSKDGERASERRSMEASLEAMSADFDACQAELSECREQLDTATGTLEDLYAEKFAAEDARKTLESKIIVIDGVVLDTSHLPALSNL